MTQSQRPKYQEDQLNPSGYCLHCHRHPDLHIAERNRECPDATGGGKRDDVGKSRMDLIPMDALYELGEIYQFGAEKYADRNWEKGMKWSRMIGPLLRHIAAFMCGIERDPESKQLHSAHMAWNALGLLTYELRGIGEDDRGKVNQRIISRNDEAHDGECEEVSGGSGCYCSRRRDKIRVDLTRLECEQDHDCNHLVSPPPTPGCCSMCHPYAKT